MSTLYSDKIKKELNLPEQVPWFGYEENGFVGSGIIGCGWKRYGIWDNLIGPAYTMPSFIQKNRIRVVINGKKYTLNGNMHRAERTGIFYSINCFQDIIVYLIDFAIMHKPFVTRMIAVHNKSDNTVEFNPYAEIKRKHEALYYKGIENDTIYRDALNLAIDNTYFMTAKFAGEKTVIRVYEEEKEIILDTKKHIINPDQTCYFTLYHYVYTNNFTPNEVIQGIDERDGITDLHDCINEWNNWLKDGKDLSFIKDDRARSIIESSIIFIRMEQGEDGGIMSNPGDLTSSYVRDNHSSLRGMLAAGHCDEAYKYLLYVNSFFDHLIKKGDFGIPTSIPIGRKGTPFFGFGNKENWACETPGLYVLTAKRYYELTKDIKTIKDIEASLRYAVNVQLEYAKAHDWKLIFNGDETESGGCGITMLESVTAEKNMFSMSSHIICIASLEFFIDYLKLSDNTEEGTEYMEALACLRKSLDENYWSEDLGVYHWFLTYDNRFPKTMMCNYQIMPLFFGGITNREKASMSALAMKQYITDSGFIPNQPLGENEDFCGHNLGYLLYALTELNDMDKDKVYNTLINGGTVGCWGMWCEAYYDDGTPYGYAQTWDNRFHNLRPFESGTNIEAIIKYWEDKK